MNLVFQLHGPMMSWGETSGQVRRSTRMVPTRSALLGLIGAAAGIGRDENGRFDELNRCLTISTVTVLEPERTSDYHTMATPKRPSDTIQTRRGELREIQTNPSDNTDTTAVTTREYLVDGLYYGVLTGDRSVVQTVQDDLNRPNWTVYAGRKAHPFSLPFHPVIVDQSFATSVRTYHHDESAFAHELKGFGANPDTVRVHSPERFSDVEYSSTHIRRDDPIHLYNNAYRTREEHVGILSLEES